MVSRRGQLYLLFLFFFLLSFPKESQPAVDGPTVCIICEYDAVANLGHACGHNLVATAGIAAALAVQDAAKVNADS